MNGQNESQDEIILGMETSGKVVSVALTCNGYLKYEKTMNNKINHSETLLPMLDEMKQALSLDLSDITAVAVSCGPGSFTGLRIGSATAKGLGLSLNIPVVGISTLEAMACNCYGMTGIICPLIDARRDQAYYGVYRFEGNGEIINYKRDSIASIEDIGRSLLNIKKERRITENGEDRIVILGDGEKKSYELLKEIFSESLSAMPYVYSYPKASNICYLAGIKYRNGIMQNASDYVPVYLKETEAERNLKKTTNP